MAKTVTVTKPHTPKKPKPIPVLATWTVTLTNGETETVIAHDCSTYNGALTFTMITGVDDEGDRDWGLVCAFSNAEWKKARLFVPNPALALD